MAKDSSLIITSTDSSGGKSQKSITNINPSAVDSILKTAANKIAVLSSNRLQKIQRIDKTDL